MAFRLHPIIQNHKYATINNHVHLLLPLNIRIAVGWEVDLLGAFIILIDIAKLFSKEKVPKLPSYQQCLRKRISPPPQMPWAFDALRDDKWFLVWLDITFSSLGMKLSTFSCSEVTHICISKNLCEVFLVYYFWAIGLFYGEGSSQLKSIQSGLAMTESGDREVKTVSKLLSTFLDKWTTLTGRV